MAGTVQDRRLLSTFPRPPPRPQPPTKLSLVSPGLSRPADFGFIYVGLDSKTHSHDYDSPSVDSPPMSPDVSHTSPILASLAQVAELQLVLDYPSKIYSPGDTLTGYIIGWDTSNCQIYLILEGTATSTLKSDKTPYINSAPFLFQVQRLAPGNDGTVPRFSITIPTTSSPSLERVNAVASNKLSSRNWTTTWPARDGYEHTPGHPLPPSMSMPTQSSTTLTSHAYGSAQIAYRLLAVRSYPHSPFPPSSQLHPHSHPPSPDHIPAPAPAPTTTTAQVPLQLTTRRLPASKMAHLARETTLARCPLSVQTAQLTKQRRLRVREQLCDAFNGAAPAFYFALRVGVPKLAVPGRDVGADIGVEVLPPPPGKSYRFAVPDVRVREVRFRLRSYTGVRVLGVRLGEKACTFKRDEVREVQRAGEDVVFRPREGKFEGQRYVARLRVPENLPPCFKTFNAWRGYRLECEIVVRVAEKDAVAKVRGDLDVVAGHG